VIELTKHWASFRGSTGASVNAPGKSRRSSDQGLVGATRSSEWEATSTARRQTAGSFFVGLQSPREHRADSGGNIVVLQRTLWRLNALRSNDRRRPESGRGNTIGIQEETTSNDARE
jgi:hypothetical protein